jgi:hypothetical protein
MEIIHGRTDRHQFWIVVENDVYGQERETAFAEEDEARASPMPCAKGITDEPRTWKTTH